MKECSVCKIDFEPSFSRRVTCSDPCKLTHRKNGQKKRNKLVGKLDCGGSNSEQAEARFKNKFLIGGLCG